MPGTKKPKKKYRPKLEYYASWVDRMRDLTRDELIGRVTTCHLALADFRSGRGGRAEWDLLATMINLSLILGEHGVGDEHLGALRSAQTAHASMCQRYYRAQRFGYSGTEMQMVALAIDIYEAQLEASTVLQVERAIDEMYKRLDRKHTVFAHPREAAGLTNA